MAAQGLEVTIIVKISVLQCDPDIFDDQYIFFLTYILLFWSYSPHFWPKIG
jgi:hypothetical protein